MEEEILKDLNKLLNKVGNYVHDSVPFDNDEDNNKIERTWG